MTSKYNEIAGVIHAKGSSERITRKNLCLLQNTPLFLCQAINLSNLIGKNNVYIDSESTEILHLSKENGFNILQRDPSLSSNATGGVKLLRNFIDSFSKKPTTVIQLFPPMPLLDLEKLKQGIECVHNLRTNNSACFIAKTKKYLWENNSPKYYNQGQEIPNGVDLPVIEYELPTAYIVNVEEFIKSNSRTASPLCKLDIENELYEIDIDYDHDFSLANSLISTPYFSSKFKFYENVRVFYPPIIFWDIDGTLTNGFYNTGPSQEVFKSFHTYDGIALKELDKIGVINCLVSASKSSKIIQERSKLLNIDCLTGVDDKVSACKNYAKQKGFNLRECYFVGNDVNDLNVMESSGRSFCPSDANISVLKIAENLKITSQQGGVARALVDLLKQEKAIERRYE